MVWHVRLNKKPTVPVGYKARPGSVNCSNVFVKCIVSGKYNVQVHLGHILKQLARRFVVQECAAAEMRACNGVGPDAATAAPNSAVRVMHAQGSKLRTDVR